MNSPALDEYRQHERTLIHLRWRNRGLDSREEDDILEAMDSVWWRLTEDERHQIDTEPPRSLIRSGDAPRRWVDLDGDVFDDPLAPVRALAEVA